jgi:magnesium chelatase subunit D
MNYPFTAIVGQERLKKALLLCAINPGIGGLLIQGDKGTAKSTAARALSEVVPPVTKVSGCLFNCYANSAVEICEVCALADKTMETVAVPFINLPLGATEERVLGSLDLEAVLVDKRKKFQPGLLAAVHQGILYIDEVNLLSDHLVDVLLDVSAMGENIIEREGLSLSHPSRFTLIGTMNPEEGQLRPQFLDRFGLMVHVDAPGDVAERTEVVRRRIAFENDPVSFAEQWTSQQSNLQVKLLAAKQLLPSVTLNDELLTLISQFSTDLGVRSLRADIVMYKTAVTLAALDQRTEVTAEDVKQAAELALAHRSRKTPFSSPKNNRPENNNDRPDEQQAPPPPPKKEQAPKQPDAKDQSSEAENENSTAEDNGQQDGGSRVEEKLFGAGTPMSLPRIDGYTAKSDQIHDAGRRSTAANVKRGTYIRSEQAKGTTDIAIDATVLHALLRNPDELDITIHDLHQKKRSGKISNLILFVVDASGSMAASKRMEAVKGTVLSLLTDAYQKRDTVGVIAFRGIEAQVLLNPTQSIELAEEAMRNLPTGGRTPLPHALQTAIQLLNRFDSKKGYNPILVILTDGKANVSLPGEGDPWGQTLALSAQLKKTNIQSLVLNSDSNYLNMGRAEELAASLGGQYLSLNDISEEQLTPIINQILA